MYVFIRVDISAIDVASLIDWLIDFHFQRRVMKLELFAAFELHFINDELLKYRTNCIKVKKTIESKFGDCL